MLLWRCCHSSAHLEHSFNSSLCISLCCSHNMLGFSKITEQTIAKRIIYSWKSMVLHRRPAKHDLTNQLLYVHTEMLSFSGHESFSLGNSTCQLFRHSDDGKHIWTHLLVRYCRCHYWLVGYLILYLTSFVYLVVWLAAGHGL